MIARARAMTRSRSVCSSCDITIRPSCGGPYATIPMPRSISGIVISERSQYDAEPRRLGRNRVHLSHCRGCGAPNDANAGDVRRQLLEQFEPFPSEAGFEIQEAGGVAPWSSQSCQISGPSRIGGIRKDDRNPTGHCILQRLKRWGAAGDGNIRPQPEQLLGILAVAVAVASGRAVLHLQIPADAPAAFGQPVKEGREAGLAFRILRGKAGQESDTRHTFRLLRPRRKRPSSDRAAESGDEFAPSKANAHLALLCLLGKKIARPSL